MTPHMVGHALRELESALRRVLLATLAVEVPEGDSDHHVRQIAGILESLGLPAGDPAAQAWLTIPGRDGGLQAWAHRRHLGRRAIDDEFHRLWAQVQLFLDVVLEAFETESVKSFDLVETLIRVDPPRAGTVKSFLEDVMKSNPVMDHFAERAPLSWLQPLVDSRFLLEAPSLDDASADATYGVLRWPLVKLISRAAVDPVHREDAVKAATKLAEVRNPVIHLELCDLALTLPPDLAVQFADFARAWVSVSQDFLLGDRLAKLAEHLADGGESDAAFAVTEALLLSSSRAAGTPTATQGAGVAGGESDD